MWPTISIRQKIFVLFTIIALVPLVAINIIWLRSSQQQLKQAAANRQSILLTISAQRLNESMNTKINDVISHSQDPNIIDLNIEQSKLKLLQFANLSPDVSRIALVDSTGNERVVVKDRTLLSTLTNVRGSDAFKVVTQVSNEASLSDVVYENNQPKITISVPLLTSSKLGDQNLSTNESLARRFGSDIKGALIVDINLNSLWQSLLSTKLGTDGYAYIVNQKGTPIAYPDSKFINSHASFPSVAEVSAALKTLGTVDIAKTSTSYTPSPQETISETGIAVLSSHFPISSAKWAIIGEEPISSVYSGVNRISLIALFIFLIAIPLSTLLIILATRSIILPIRGLTQEALRLGAGDFGHPLKVKGKDELATLAKTFNKMGDDLQKLIGQYKDQNLSLAAERSKLQAVLDTITDGVIVLNQSFNIVLANKTMTMLTHSSPSSLAGQPWLKAFALSYNGKPFDNGLLKGELLFLKGLVLNLGDQQKYLDVTAVQLHNDPTGIAYILTIHDITEEQVLESMKVDFVSMAAHELRTPLTSIRGYLELLHDEQTDLSPQHRKYLERSIISGKLLASLINNLLNVSNIERGQLNVAWSKADLAQIIQACIRDQLMTAQEKGLKLTYTGPSEGLWVIGDEVLLREVVNNFVSNAIHYTDAGSVTVDSNEQKGVVTTRVQDTGYGIPAVSIPHLFTKFFRGETSLTATTKGTGLGLFISKAIVTSHHGTVSVESKEGKGSTFSFILPAYDEIHYNTLKAAPKKKDDGKTL